MSRPIDYEIPRTTINELRFLMLMGIIAIHSNLNSHFNLPAPASIIVEYISAVLSSMCVPAYFLISGYLFFKGMTSFSWKIYTGKLKRRVNSLLIPYILWNCIGLICLLVKKSSFASSAFSQYDVIDLSFLSLLKGFWSLSLIDNSLPDYPYDFVLWFVRDLMVMVVASPLFYFAIRYLKWIPLCLLAAPILIPEPFMPEWLSQIYIFPTAPSMYFYIGSALALSRIGITRFFSIGTYTLLPAVLFSILTLFFGHSDYSSALKCIYILTAIPATGLIVYRLVSRGKTIPHYISSSGFFVYASHGLWCTLCARMIASILHPASNLSFICLYILTFLSLFGVSFAIYLIIKRYAPSILVYLSGGRG